MSLPVTSTSIVIWVSDTKRSVPTALLGRPGSGWRPAARTGWCRGRAARACSARAAAARRRRRPAAARAVLRFISAPSASRSLCCGQGTVERTARQDSARGQYQLTPGRGKYQGRVRKSAKEPRSASPDPRCGRRARDQPRLARSSFGPLIPRPHWRWWNLGSSRAQDFSLQARCSSWSCWPRRRPLNDACTRFGWNADPSGHPLSCCAIPRPTRPRGGN